MEWEEWNTVVIAARRDLLDHPEMRKARRIRAAQAARRAATRQRRTAERLAREALAREANAKRRAERLAIDPLFR